MYLGDVLAPNLILKTSTPKEIKGDSRGFSIGLERVLLLIAQVYSKPLVRSLIPTLFWNWIYFQSS
jgi:hypothetical protein